jgi:Ferritin-like domain
VSTTRSTSIDGTHLSDGELLAMTRDLDEMHRDLFSRFQQAVAQMTEGWREWAESDPALSRGSASRRSFLHGGLVTTGAVGGAALLAACGGGSSGPATGGSVSRSSSAAEPADLTVARLAASLEALAVGTYQTVLDAAQRGTLGAVPPAIGTFVTTAKTQHADHENAWNAALKSAGRPVQTAPDPQYKKLVDAALPNVMTVEDAARLALTLETVAVETYTAGSARMSSKAHRLVALTIAPVEAQHVAVLYYVLGQYPVPDAFITTDMAASPQDLSES